MTFETRNQASDAMPDQSQQLSENSESEQIQMYVVINIFE